MKYEVINTLIILYNLQGKAKVQDLYDEVCNALGVKETQFFGLAILKRKFDIDLLL